MPADTSLRQLLDGHYAALASSRCAQDIW